MQAHVGPLALGAEGRCLGVRNGGCCPAVLTEIVEMPGRGHALTIDHGWREVPDTALIFIRRFA